MVKKLTTLSLVFAVLLSCFAGCGANRKEDSTQPQQSAGYVQEEISVPLEDGYSQDMVMLPDGRLWMAVNSTDGKSAVLLTSNEARTEWEKTEALPDEVLASGGVWSVTLSDLGEMYVITCKGDGEETPRTFRYWYQAPGANIKEVTLHAADMEFDEHTMLFEAEFIAEGTVLQSVMDSSMRQIDLRTGEISENKDDRFCCFAGQGVGEAHGFRFRRGFGIRIHNFHLRLRYRRGGRGRFSPTAANQSKSHCQRKCQRYPSFHAFSSSLGSLFILFSPVLGFRTQPSGPFPDQKV